MIATFDPNPQRTIPDQLADARAENKALRALAGLSETAAIPTPAAVAARPVAALVVAVAAAPVDLTRAQAFAEFNRLTLEGTAKGSVREAGVFYAKHRAILNPLR